MSTLLNASLTAMSEREPTLPMDWVTPSRRQVRRERLYLEKLTAQALALAESQDPGKAFASLMRSLAAAGPVKMTLLDLLPPHDDDGQGLSRPVTEAADAFRAALDGALHRAQAAGAARPDVTGDDASLLLRALAYATDLSEGEALDRAVDIVLDGLGVPR
ncbi:hypothetical protein [Streptomyces sp. NPDC056682]|uniref:SbtR family transcriptional regulator n=1 Tax=Streptomyces sp. NPDC056682 TaxID=3345909 RepID=UPI003678C716